MQKIQPKFKICKYCGSYYSPEGTWIRIDGEWICKNCYKEHQHDVPTQNMSYHREKKKSLFRKLFK